MFNTMTDIRHANYALGHCWFAPDTMRWWHSRIVSGVLGERYFVTSECQDDNHPRLFTVRMANDDGSIDTVSDFQQFRTLTEARVWLWKNILEGK
jgi:hypothetical protein